MFGVLKLGKLGASMKKAGFNPRTLFAASEPGAWYDPSDMSTLFQDSAGTVPVTAVEQPVGLMLDKSGRGNHAFQATATRRPVLRQDGNGKYYLLCDGIDDGMQTNSIDFTATDKMTVFAGVRKLSDAGRGIIVELSGLASDLRKFVIDAPLDTTKKYRVVMAGDGWTNPEYAYTSVNFSAPDTSVLSANFDRKLFDSSVLARVDGGLSGVFSSPFYFTDNFGNYPLFIGCRGGTTFHFNGHLGSLIIRGASSTAAEIAAAEAYVNSKIGAY